MDLVAACRVFVHVGEHGSVTGGAASARVAQSVASRRVAALEQYLGVRLLDRTTRRTGLTVLGRDMLPVARQLVRLADAMVSEAEQARLRPLSIAVPETCSTRDLAVLDASAQGEGAALDVVQTGPYARDALVTSGKVRAALRAVPPTGAAWVVRLGAAGSVATTAGLRVEALRPGRREQSPVRLWLQPEDDVPHVRDVATRAGHRAGLLPSQVSVATSSVSAVAHAFLHRDLVVCLQAQAEDLGLHWVPILAPVLARGYDVVAGG